LMYFQPFVKSDGYVTGSSSGSIGAVASFSIASLMLLNRSILDTALTYRSPVSSSYATPAGA
jgi:hypothetical protein